MPKLESFFKEVDTAIPYLTREVMTRMYENEETFDVTAITERIGAYMNKPREEWVITIKLHEDGSSALATFVKSANRDNFMEALKSRLPVTDVKFDRRGKQEAWVFVPASQPIATDEAPAQEAPAARSPRTKR